MGLHSASGRRRLSRGSRRRITGRMSGPGCPPRRASRTPAGQTTWQLAPALVVLGADMGLVFVPLLPYILSAVPPGDVGAASGVANAVQQVGATLGVSVLGAVFFNQLAAAGDYGHAFTVAAALQIALLLTCAAVSLILPRRIAAGAYQPTL